MRYKFKTKYSESDEYTVYRYYHYTPRQLGIRGFLATVCAAIAIFILVPFPDEIVVIPAIAKALQHAFQLEFNSAIGYAYGVYKAIGLIFLGLALLFGAQYLRDALLAKVKHVKDTERKVRHYVQNGHSTLKHLARKR
jgi:hypothetical protein